MEYRSIFNPANGRKGGKLLNRLPVADNGEAVDDMVRAEGAHISSMLLCCEDGRNSRLGLSRHLLQPVEHVAAFCGPIGDVVVSVGLLSEEDDEGLWTGRLIVEGDAQRGSNLPLRRRSGGCGSDHRVAGGVRRRDAGKEGEEHEGEGGRECPWGTPGHENQDETRHGNLLDGGEVDWLVRPRRPPTKSDNTPHGEPIAKTRGQVARQAEPLLEHLSQGPEVL